MKTFLRTFCPQFIFPLFAVIVATLLFSLAFGVDGDIDQTALHAICGVSKPEATKFSLNDPSIENAKPQLEIGGNGNGTTVPTPSLPYASNVEREIGGNQSVPQTPGMPITNCDIGGNGMERPVPSLPVNNEKTIRYDYFTES